MGENIYSDLYDIVRIVEEKKGQADLQEVKRLLNGQMRLRTVPRGEPIFYNRGWKKTGIFCGPGKLYQLPDFQEWEDEYFGAVNGTGVERRGSGSECLQYQFYGK